MEYLKNPFKVPATTDPNLTSLAEQGFLPPDEVAKLKDLEGDKGRSSKFEVPSSMSDISLEEGMSAKERQTYEKMKNRQQVIDWAKKYNLGDEDWVDSKITFASDGSVTLNGDINRINAVEFNFPECIKTVTGFVNLGIKSAVGLHLPDKIGDYLDLSALKDHEGLFLPSSVGGFLDLSGLKTAKGLVFPKYVKDTVYLDGMEVGEEFIEIRNKYPHLKIV